MKLTRIKLINWHIFTDTTLTLAGNTLVTGENGSGKSTLIDAIYYVLSGGDDRRFNTAANEDAKRSVLSYVRGRLGAEGLEMLRPGSVISHIALEFSEGARQKVLGTVIEAEGSAAQSKFYVMEERGIEEEDYADGRNVRSFSELKSRMKAGKAAFTELPGAKRQRGKTIATDVLKLSGNGRYAELLQKAIAFRPIREVSAFVNDFLLSEDNVDIASLQGEARAYRGIKENLEREKEKKTVLEKFVGKAQKYLDNARDLRCLSVLRTEAEISSLTAEAQRLGSELQKLKTEAEETKQERDGIREKLRSREEERIRLENDERLRAIQEKERRVDALRKESGELTDKIRGAARAIQEEMRIVRRFEWGFRLGDAVNDGNFPLWKEHLRAYGDRLEGKKRELADAEASERQGISRLDEEIRDCNAQLRTIRSGQNNYDRRTMALLDAVREGLEKKHKIKIDVRPLCECLEITDAGWRNAIEGYLNTRRFDLIVDPRYFDDAAEIYERVRADGKIYGVGIMYCADDGTLPPPGGNSLYGKVKATTGHADLAARAILGRVACAGSVRELKQYPAAVTETCMVYQNRTVRGINPEIYRTPFIGRESVTVRKKLLEDKLALLEGKRKEAQGRIGGLKTDRDAADRSRVRELLGLDNIWKKKQECDDEASRLSEELEASKKDLGFVSVMEGIAAVKERISALRAEDEKCGERMRAQDRKQGELEADIRNRVNELDSLKEKRDRDVAGLNAEERERCGELRGRCSVKGKPDAKKISEAASAAQGYNNSCKGEIERGMREYARLRPGMPDGIENIPVFLEEYGLIVSRDIADYSDRAKAAYDECIAQFKSDFVNKLAAKIRDAKKTLSDINRKLKNKPFGTDGEIYQFTWDKSGEQEMKEYYRIITSDKVMEASSLLDAPMDGSDQEIMQRLFDSIIGEADGAEAEKKLDRYLDYRSYMSFDIKTVNKRGDETFFSKTSREKSGGETQTPFYVIIATCFDQLITKGNETSSICAVVFDEAFNNMDEGRIGALMEFYGNLNIQIVAVVPTNRAPSLFRYMDTKIGLIKTGNRVTAYEIKDVAP